MQQKEKCQKLKTQKKVDRQIFRLFFNSDPVTSQCHTYVFSWPNDDETVNSTRIS